MKKLLLILVVLAGAALSVPAVRAAIDPALSAVAAPARSFASEQVARVRDPVYRWSVRNEARGLARELVERQEAGLPLPRPSEYQDYLRKRTLAEREVTDRWGSPYYLLLNRDSLAVVSPGPDRRPGTGDDIRAALSRS